MKRIRVSSSVLRSVGYDAASRTLQVEFVDGDVYDYLAVPEEAYRTLMRSASHGEYFNAAIKPYHAVRKR